MPKKTAKAKSSSEADNDSGTMFPLSKNRTVNVQKYNNRVLVNIREYYEDAAGEMKPGRKGIALTKEQWLQLKEFVQEIDLAIADTEDPAPEKEEDEEEKEEEEKEEEKEKKEKKEKGKKKERKEKAKAQLA